jgi:AcrR family transcriptional regulator
MKTDQRIREAMVRLALKQGYNKTTMQDIAQEAGVARSTLYTKWKTKEALFEDILWQESEAYMDAWYALVERDPDGGSLRGVYRNAVLAIRKNPVMLALYTQNSFFVGSFANEEPFVEAMAGMLLWNVRWLEQLQAQGLIRADVDVQTAAWIEVIFRQGLLAMPVDMGDYPNVDYETVLDLFFTMFQQHVGVDADFPSDAGKKALKAYIESFKARYLSDN